MSLPPELVELAGGAVDTDVLHARYLAERDRRVREDGNAQYTEAKAEFSRYVEDPYVAPGFTRQAFESERVFSNIVTGPVSTQACRVPAQAASRSTVATVPLVSPVLTPVRPSSPATTTVTSTPGSMVSSTRPFGLLTTRGSGDCSTQLSPRSSA